VSKVSGLRSMRGCHREVPFHVSLLLVNPKGKLDTVEISPHDQRIGTASVQGIG